LLDATNGEDIDETLDMRAALALYDSASFAMDFGADLDSLRKMYAGLKQLGYPKFPLEVSRQQVHNYLADVDELAKRMPVLTRLKAEHSTWNFVDLEGYYLGR
jgi:hypothetical protein